LYILYNSYGPYYVGIVKADRLGHRLRDHLKDKHRRKWDRFSWFGFREVRQKLDFGLSQLGPSVRGRTSTSVGSGAVIGDIEALLIAGFGLGANVKRSPFRGKQEWKQMTRERADQFLDEREAKKRELRQRTRLRSLRHTRRRPPQ
jgi:hypothetical protein